MNTERISYIDRKTMKTEHRIIIGDSRKMESVKDNSVHLVVTSPPYWQLKDYGNGSQIGFDDSYEDYINNLNLVWKECYRVLHPGCRAIINIGDQFLSTTTTQVYQIIPLHSMIVSRLLIEMKNELVYLGSINWLKVSTSNTSGGGKIMGSYPFPRSGYFFVNREYIAIFRKVGKKNRNQQIHKSLKVYSRLTLEEWREYFKDTWKFSPAIQNSHIAMFPEELSKRLIKMYSFVGDTILDPFLGSGTTILTASKLGRNSLGYEIGFRTKNNTDWKELIKKKITIPKIEFQYPLASNHEKNKILYGKILIKNNYKYEK